MGLGYCLGVIDKINQSEIARRDVQKTLCSTILPNYDDFELFFKGDILRLADVLGIAKEELRKMLDLLALFKNDASKDSFSECMAIPLY